MEQLKQLKKDIAEKAKMNYNKRKDAGTLKKKVVMVPKIRGRPKKDISIIVIKEPKIIKQRGRKPNLHLNENDILPMYLKKQLEKKIKQIMDEQKIVRQGHDY